MPPKMVASLLPKKRPRSTELDEETKKQMNIYMSRFLNNRSVLQIPKASGSYGADSADESSAEEDDEYDSETGARKRTVKRSKANEEMGGEGSDDEEDDDEEEEEEEQEEEQEAAAEPEPVSAGKRSRPVDAETPATKRANGKQRASKQPASAGK